MVRRGAIWRIATGDYLNVCRDKMRGAKEE